MGRTDGQRSEADRLAGMVRRDDPTLAEPPGHPRGRAVLVVVAVLLVVIVLAVVSTLG